MTKELTPQFSRKVLLVSIIFLLANLGIYTLRFMVTQPFELRSVAPKLISATIEQIEIKTPFDEDYRFAQAGQEITSGTTIRTSDAEFAELVLESNVIRLDEQTEIRLVKNNFSESSHLDLEDPTLEIELIAGSVWVDAFNLIEIKSPRSVTRLEHGIGLITYSEPINRLMVVTGAANLGLLSAEGEYLSDFVVPLHNQVTFINDQITSNYAALKPSKLKKELKMSPIAASVLNEEWVLRNANDFVEARKVFENSLITSKSAYQIQSRYQNVLSYITFIPEARRNLAIEKARTMIAYLLGAVQNEGDIDEAAKIIEAFDALVDARKNDPMIKKLITETLYSIEYSRCGSPAYLLKENLINELIVTQGTHIYDIYLTDLRRAFYEKDIQTAEIVAGKWLDSWKNSLVEKNASEFDRQSQILNHTILSYIDIVTSSLLGTFDSSGAMKIAYAKDLEEARFEVISDRLQITASLIFAYRYSFAKQYLKNSYLSLGIEDLSPSLASTKIFLENGKFMAQRIEYAESVLHGAAEPIDETKFLDYFRIIKRDEALSEDLRKFFELDTKEVVVETRMEAPTAAQVAERFLDARINVNYADISLKSTLGFYYSVQNARLIDRGSKGELLSFDADYDFVTDSVSDVRAGDKIYKGPTRLNDLVTLLRSGGKSEPTIPTPKIEEGIELLITDREKIEAQEGQAIAQDVARQLAYNKLNSYGIIIPEAKFDIEILNTLTLNEFRIKNAFIPRPDGKESIAVSFEYNSGTEMATKVVGQEGRTLLNSVPIATLKDRVLEEVTSLEKELTAIGDFTTFAKLNDLYIDPETIIYTSNDLLSFRDLELLTLELKVSGLYNPQNKVFASVSHSLLSSQNIGVKEYFTLLVNELVISFMQQNGYQITIDQIQTKYPFEQINIKALEINGVYLDFILDMVGARALKVTGAGIKTPIEEVNLSQLPDVAAQINLISPEISE